MRPAPDHLQQSRYELAIGELERGAENLGGVAVRTESNAQVPNGSFGQARLAVCTRVRPAPQARGRCCNTPFLVRVGG